MKFKNWLNNYYHSIYYLATIVVSVVLGWYFNAFLVGAGICLCLAGISFFVCDDVMSLFPALIPFPYMFKSLIFADYIKYIPFLIIVFALIISGIVYFLVKKLKYEKVKTKKGKLFWGIIISYASMIFAGSFSSYFNWLHVLCMLGIGIGMYLVYWLLINFSGKDAIRYICRIVLMMAVIVVAEMWIYYLTCGNIIAAMQNKTVRVGMGEINTAAQYLALAIPCVLYLGTKSEKYDYLYLLLGLFLYVNIIFTLSRTVILFSTIMLPVLFVYAIIKNKNRVKMFASFCVILLCAIVFVFVFKDKITTALSWLLEKGISGNGRNELWAFCYDIFKNNPVFGSGFMLPESFDYGPAASSLILAHNTPLQLLTCCGIIGLVGHLLFYFQKYKYMIVKMSVYKFFMLIGIIMVELFGIFDPTFVNLLMTMIVYSMIANAENESEVDRVKLNFKKEVRNV